MAAYKIAHLKDDQAEKIQELERELDVCALAMEPGLELAQLAESQLAKVRKLEKELGCTLVIYREC